MARVGWLLHPVQRTKMTYRTTRWLVGWEWRWRRRVRLRLNRCRENPVQTKMAGRKKTRLLLCFLRRRVSTPARTAARAESVAGLMNGDEWPDLLTKFKVGPDDPPAIDSGLFFGSETRLMCVGVICAEMNRGCSKPSKSGFRGKQQLSTGERVAGVGGSNERRTSITRKEGGTWAGLPPGHMTLSCLPVAQHRCCAFHSSMHA